MRRDAKFLVISEPQVLPNSDRTGRLGLPTIKSLTQHGILHPQFSNQREILLLPFFQPVHTGIQPVQILTLRFNGRFRARRPEADQPAYGEKQATENRNPPGLSVR